MAYTKEYEEYKEGKDALATWKILVWTCDKCGFEVYAAPARGVQIRERIKAHQKRCKKEFEEVI